MNKSVKVIKTDQSYSILQQNWAMLAPNQPHGLTWNIQYHDKDFQMDVRKSWTTGYDFIYNV